MYISQHSSEFQRAMKVLLHPASKRQYARHEQIKETIYHSLREAPWHIEEVPEEDRKQFLVSIGDDLPRTHAIYQIAKVVFQLPSKNSCDLVQHLLTPENIEDLEVFIGILKLLAKKEPKSVLPLLQKHWIADESIRIEIAKSMAANDGQELSRNIAAYKISDEKARVAIAKIAAERSPVGVSEYIDNYVISQERDRFEIAEIVARHSDIITTCIQNYKISNEILRAQIAMITVKHSKAILPFFIASYQINEEDLRIQIAKVAAECDPNGLSQYIDTFRISKESDRIEIAKIIAKRAGYSVSQYIRKFNIQNQSALIEIAKIAVRQSEWGVSLFIQNYGILEEQSRLEIAKMAASHKGNSVSKYIQNYQISEEGNRVAIAKIVASSNGNALSDNILNYEIQDEKARIEIAKIAAAEYGVAVFKNMAAYKILSRDIWVEIAKIAAGNRSTELILVFRDHPEYQSAFWIAVLLQAIEDPRQVQSYIKESDCIDDPSALRRKVMFFLPADLSEPLEKACQYRNKPLAKYLIHTLAEKGSDPKYQEAYRLLSTGLKHKQLLSIIPAVWAAEAKGAQEAEIVKSLSTQLEQRREIWKNRSSRKMPLLQTYLLAVKALNQVPYLNSIRKLQLVTAVLSHPSEEAVILGLKLLEILSMKNAERQLVELDLKNPIAALEKGFEEILLDDPFVDLSGIDELIPKYFERFAKMRIPYAIDRYIEEIRRLGDIRMQEPLQRFIRSVLLDNFTSVRNQVEDSPHLQRLKAYDEQEGTFIFSLWQKLQVEVDVVSAAGEKTSDFSFEVFFQNKLKHRHWVRGGNDQLPQLTAFLQTSDPTLRAKNKQALQASANPSIADQIALACIELIENTEQKEEQLEKIDHLLKHIEIELANDIRGLRQTVSAAPSNMNKEKAILTRDWQDLFLSGTEVMGSCQRIDGDPAFTKCLLAYCLDGKNQMIAVKDQNGVILARRMLKLLWDETSQRPALFLDELYPATASSEQEKAIQIAAKQCAQALGCSLFIANALASSSLTSFGSSCPYEYEDGAQGVEDEGLFTITEAEEIFRPVET